MLLTNKPQGGWETAMLGRRPNIEAAARLSQNRSPQMKSAVFLWSNDNISDYLGMPN